MQGKKRWLLPVVAFLSGIVVWALPNVLSVEKLPDINWENFSHPNRYSELGAAIAGGAIIATVVLVVEEISRAAAQKEAANLATAAEYRANVFQATLQQDTLKFQEKLQKDALRFQIGLQEEITGMDLRGEDFKETYWRGKAVHDSYLSGVKLDNAFLWECDFSKTYLYGASFVRAKLRKAKFEAAQLGGADFKGADLTEANFLGAILQKDRDPVGGEEFGDVNLAEADIEGVDFGGANLTAVKGIAEARNFDKIRKLKGANLAGVNLAGATFGGVDLTKVDFDGTDVRGANLSAVGNIEKARNLDKVKWNSSTEWPGGEPPEGVGLPIED